MIDVRNGPSDGASAVERRLMPILGVFYGGGCCYMACRGLMLGGISDVLLISHGPIGCAYYAGISGCEGPGLGVGANAKEGADATAGTQGSNGGNVTLNTSSQAIDGDMLVDDVSALNLYLQDESSFSGAVNPSGQEGDVYVELDANSTWTLTGDSYVTSLTCVPGSIDLNGYALYVNGVAYDGESASAGEAIDMSAGA